MDIPLSFVQMEFIIRVLAYYLGLAVVFITFVMVFDQGSSIIEFHCYIELEVASFRAVINFVQSSIKVGAVDLVVFVATLFVMFIILAMAIHFVL